MRRTNKLGARLQRLAYEVAAMRTTVPSRVTTFSKRLGRLWATHPPTARRVAVAACALGTAAGVAMWNIGGLPSPHTTVAAQTAAGRRPAAPRAGQDRAQLAADGGADGGELANQDRAAQNRAPRGLFAGLRVGQAIAVKETAGRFELTYYEDVPLGPVGPRIAELGPDYVVIDDGVGISETRIPIYSIKSIVRFKALRAR